MYDRHFVLAVPAAESPILELPLMPAKLTISVRRAAGLEAMDRGGKSDPFVVIKVGTQAAQNTSVKEKTLDPA